VKPGVAWAVIGAFVLSCAWVVTSSWRTRDHVRDPSVFVEAVRAHTDLLHAGDTLLVHPPWRDDVMRAVRDAHVVPPDVDVTVALAPPHGAPLPPLVLLREHEGPPLPRVLARLVHNEDVVRVGDLELVRLTPSDALAGRDVTDHLESAQVRVERTTANGTRDDVNCAWDAARRVHTCPSLPAWVHVGKERVVIDEQPRLCVWQHPTASGVVSTTLPHVHIEGALDFALALSDTAADNADAPAVHARVLLDGVPVLDVDRRHARGFDVHRIPVATPRDVDVTVQTTAVRDGQRHVCWRMSTHGATP
jgi:hypothetical protein